MQCLFIVSSVPEEPGLLIVKGKDYLKKKLKVRGWGRGEGREGVAFSPN